MLVFLRNMLLVVALALLSSGIAGLTGGAGAGPTALADVPASSTMAQYMQGAPSEGDAGSDAWFAGVLGQQVEDDRDSNEAEPSEEEHFALASMSAAPLGSPGPFDSLVKRNELLARWGVPIRLERPPRTIAG